MSSSHRILGARDGTVFTTRPAGSASTTLFIRRYPFGGNPPVVSWHKELCCEDYHSVQADKVVIATAGELLTVWNVDPDFATVEVFTDYI